VVLGLYARSFAGRALNPAALVVSADEKTSVQVRCRCHPTLPVGRAQAMRVEHEDERRGALAYLAAWDVHHASLSGRRGPTTGIAPFDRLVAQVMTTEPYASAERGCWVVDNGSSPAAKPHSDGWRAAGATCAWSTCRCMRRGSARSRSTSPSSNARCWPNDFTDPAMVERRLLGFQDRYQQTAVPFDWRYTKADLDRLLRRLQEHERFAAAA
jgi:hypothetical protein